jgi:hypothetical protein
MGLKDVLVEQVQPFLHQLVEQSQLLVAFEFILYCLHKAELTLHLAELAL